MIRSAAAGLLWILTTVLLAVAVPAAWAQINLVDQGGYAALAERAAADPDLQSAMATELTSSVGRISGAADSTAVSAIARAYTAGSAFPGQFGAANAFAHRWLFTGPGAGTDVDSQGRWIIDLAPMLSDVAFAQTLRDYNISVPTTVPVALTDTTPTVLRPGGLRTIGLWWPWATGAIGLLTAGSGLLMVLLAPRRGRALAALGVSAMLVAGTGWAAIEFAQRYVRSALDFASADLRTVAEVMVATAQDGMHQWLNVTLIAGVGLVVIGMIVSLLSGLAGPASGAGKKTPVRT